jgi:hypothetical protein
LFGDLAVATAVVDDIVVLQSILHLTLLEAMPIPKADAKLTFNIELYV